MFTNSLFTPLQLLNPGLHSASEDTLHMAIDLEGHVSMAYNVYLRYGLTSAAGVIYASITHQDPG